MIAIPRVKVCCISSVEEARLAVRMGASALGLVSHMPSGPGVIPDELIAEIANAVPPPIATFLLTARRDAEGIVDQHAVCQTSTLQLVDSVARSELQKLRRRLPAIKIVQVVHVMGDQSIEEAAGVAKLVDALLLDSENPTLAVKELGGTGRTHDWEVSKKIRERVDCPVFLAGGLRATNVREAIRSVQPFGLDLCSSVRAEGRLSPGMLSEFMQAVRSVA